MKGKLPGVTAASGAPAVFGKARNGKNTILCHSPIWLVSAAIGEVGEGARLRRGARIGDLGVKAAL